MRDSLVDINVMKSALPEHTIAVGIPDHEHVDMIWGRDVKQLVIPHVLEALASGRKGRKATIFNGTHAA
jgi:lysosomal acid lipase/cholesteryl ester hydrolase